MENYTKKIVKFLTLIMNVTLLIVGIALCFVLFIEAFNIAKLAFEAITGDKTYIKIVEEIIYFFLYFEFVALIVKYFTNNFHFPLRYFIYIGITAVIRLIITDHSTSTEVLLWGITILVLSCSLAIVNKFVQHD